MKTSYLASIIAIMALIFSLYAGAEEPNAPPIAQPLVREGEFAGKLVEALRMTPAQSEAEAENILTAVGISPQRGWIADYPVTPIGLVEIEKGVASAADTGKLGMSREEALKAMGDLKGEMGLNVVMGGGSRSGGQALPGSHPADTLIYKYIDRVGVVNYTDRYETIPEEYRNQLETIRGSVQPPPYNEPDAEDPGTEGHTYADDPEPDVINNYYIEEGPPVVTYYPPPDAYYGMYSWVPYPFWYSGFFFSGFFILRDFHRPIIYHKKSFVVSNHLFDHHRKRVITVDPHKRIHGETFDSKGARPGGISGREGTRDRGSIHGNTGSMANRSGRGGGTDASAFRPRGSGNDRTQPTFTRGLDRGGRERSSGPGRTSGNRGGAIRGIGDINRRSGGEVRGQGTFGSQRRAISPSGRGSGGFSNSIIRQDRGDSSSFSGRGRGGFENRGFNRGGSSGSGSSFKGFRGGGGRGGR